MVVETYVRGAAPVYERVAERGRMLLPGLDYVDSWVDADLQRCFQLIETEDRALLDEWTKSWSDLVSFEIVPLVDSAEAAARARDGTSRILSLLFSGVRARLAYAAAKLGVADALADRPLELDELARRTGANRDALRRVMRVLVAEGLFTEVVPTTYEATETGRALSERKYDALLVGEHIDRVFAYVLDAVRTGRPAAERTFGSPYYEWLNENPDAAAIFNGAMTAGARAAVPTLVQLDVWRNAVTTVDIGGGNGTTLAALLAEHPHLRGVVFDLPHAEADARARLAAAGVADRGSFAAGDFFEAVPAGADVYFAVQVLHNWSDDDAVRILASIRTAMPATGRLVLIEIVASEDGAETALADVLSLVWLGGKERTQDEWRHVLGRGGFELTAITRGERVAAIAARPI